MSKVILISIDGMRPDGAMSCGNPFVSEMMKLGTYCLKETTVMPSSTLPCHMSMFHSVPPTRHGIITNTYMPMVRPLNGLFEQAKMAGKTTAMFYGWEPLRDIARPGSLDAAEFMHSYLTDRTDAILTDKAIRHIEQFKSDLVFLYMVETDEKGGHDSGWMTETYLSYVSAAIDNVKRVYEKFGGEYTVIVTADHGGHDRGHGSELPEDMTIPIFLIGDRFEPGCELDSASILDVAPTVADLLGVYRAPEWEGRSLAK